MKQDGEKLLQKIVNRAAVECTHVMSPEGFIKLDAPIMSNEYRCPYCDHSGHVCPFIDPSESVDRGWMCLNSFCPTFTRRSRARECLPTRPPVRALEWPLFCEMNGIGDLCHNVKFEEIDQSAGKIEYLTKFVEKPKGLIMMQGAPGTGKTYAAMALCEKFSRTSRSLLFTTQKQLADSWLKSFREEKQSHYADGLMRCQLLVIDDFGTAEISKSLLEFIMQLINTRLQWSNRGTVITTNLSATKLAEFCGDALVDRFNTGQKFAFTGKSRRKEIVL